MTSRLLSWRTAIEAALAGLLTTAAVLIVFGPIWSAMDGPLGAGDMLATYINVDNWTGFGFATTTHFGFPSGMNLNYSPSIDITENGFARLVDLVTGSPFAGLNALLFLSFPIVAVLTYLLLRLVSRGGPIAIALSVAYATIPYHFGRGLGHTYLATMYGGVTGLTLALVIGLGLIPVYLRRRRGTRRILAATAVAALVVVTAWSGLYYAAFGVILGAAAVVWRIAKRDGWGDVGLAAVPVLLVALLALGGFLPAVLTTASDPPTASLSERMPIESVTFAGSLAMALIPAPISQLPGMWRYNSAVTDAINAVGTQLENTALTNYGTWITSACVVVFLVGWLVLARTRRVGPLPLIGYLTVVVVLFFVPWGLNYLVAATLTAQVRAWNRLLPVLLLLFVLGAMAVVGRTRLARVNVWSVVVAVVILAIVTVEQVMPFRTAYAEGAQRGALAASVARTYVADVNAAIPQDCGILQLPFAVYPEQGTIEPTLNDYEHFLQGLVNDDKDYSYGAVKNTVASELAASIGSFPNPDELDRLRRAGFCAIHVDARGYTPPALRRITQSLTEQLGPPVAIGNDGVWLTFALSK